MELFFIFAAFAVGYLAGRYHASRIDDVRVKPQGGGGPGEPDE